MNSELPPASATEIIPVTAPEDLAPVQALLLEYAGSLRYHICFESFQAELAQLPGLYGPPAGRLLFARIDQQPAGCVAVKRIDEHVAELKRLYVRPAFRCRGLGRQLAGRALSEAREIGYRVLRLDTMPSMTEARNLYRSLGFRPVAGVEGGGGEQPIVMEIQLRGA
jgi:putative acetyltransferase